MKKKRNISDIGEMKHQMNIVFESRASDGAGGKKGPGKSKWRENVWCAVTPWKFGISEFVRGQHFQDSERLTFETYYDSTIDKSRMMIEFPAAGTSKKRYRIIEMENINQENCFLKLNCVEEK